LGNECISATATAWWYKKKLCHVHRTVTCYLVLISVDAFAPRWTFCQENALSEVYVPMAKPLNMRARPTSNLQTSILSWISDEFFVSQSAFVGHESLEAFTPVIIIDARFYGCWHLSSYGSSRRPKNRAARVTWQSILASVQVYKAEWKAKFLSSSFSLLHLSSHS